MKTIFKAWIGLVAMILFQSCQSYKQLDLDPENILEEVEGSRKVSVQTSLTFDQVTQLMSERNHSIAMGALCIVYTCLGGMEAVIWTDVTQVIILTVGAIKYKRVTGVSFNHC